MEQAYIVEAVRTPIGRGRPDGGLHATHPVKLLAATLGAVCERAGVNPLEVEDVIAGCVTPILDQGANIARLSVLMAGFPETIPGVQINRMCGSGEEAVHFASLQVAAGDTGISIGAGIEMMSRVPMGSDWGVVSSEEFQRDFPHALKSMGECAELIADRWGLSREALDAYAAESHRRAHAAREAGWFDSQIVPIGGNGVARLERDEGIRPSVDPAKMASLPTPFKENGKITAANASQISDGAGALLLANGETADRLGLRRRARVVARATVGSDPGLTLTGPAPATRKVLAKAGLHMADMDFFEVNEAFASAVLVWAKEMGLGENDMARVNPNGGAIAMGHPLGASGAILMTKMVHELERTGARYALQTMCCAHGMATATIIERVEN